MSGRAALSPRLAMAAGLVPGDRKNIRLADIGTDHAYLPVWLLQNRGADLAHVIAADLRPGPLDRARQTVRAAGLEGAVDFRLCDGLEGLRPGEADVIVIAGMGGETIAAILSAAPWTWREDCLLLLQPMSAQPQLRLWLQEHGYTIAREILTREGDTIYTTFQVKAGPMPELTAGELWAGRQSRGEADPLRSEYLNRLIDQTGRAVEGLRRSTRSADAGRLDEMERAHQGLLELREEWLSWQP